jgi:hypothetical protein
MEHLPRWGAVIAVALGSFALACGGADPEPAPDDATSQADGVDPELDGQGDEERDPEWGLDFEITGRTTPMTARAELKVNEGDPRVHVAITGRTSGTDVLMIDLTFDGIENALGPHQVEFALPDVGAYVANGSLDGNWYYSQGGRIDMTISADGDIAGTFDIALALGDLGAPGDPVVFEPDAVATPLTGQFSGDWVLNCHSRLAGHSTLILGGQFCDNLEL